MLRIRISTIRASFNSIPSVQAAAVVKSGNCGTSANYTLYDNGVLVIDGTGEIDYSFESYNPHVKYIKIEEGITGIGDKIFSGLECKVAELPTTLKTIGLGAFGGTSLKYVNLPDGLASIGISAFYGTNLTSIEIPSSVRTMGKSAFAWSGLDEVVICNGITELPEEAFQGTHLEIVVIPGSVKKIGAGAFQSCKKLTTAILCDGVETWGEHAFDNLKILALPDSFRGYAISDLGEPDPVLAGVVYCNEGTNAHSRFKRYADIVVGYSRFC